MMMSTNEMMVAPVPARQVRKFLDRQEDDTLQASWQRAVDTVLAHSAETGHEKAVLLSSTGEWLFVQEGDAEHVQFNEGQLRMIGAQAGQGILVHSHPQPGGGSLSQPDILFATTHAVEIWAVTEDGGRYGTRGLLRNPTPRNKELFVQIEVEVEFHVSRSFGKEQRSLAFAHLFNLELEKVGLLHYQFAIDPRTAAALNEQKPVRKTPFDAMLEQIFMVVRSSDGSMEMLHGGDNA